MNKVFNSPASVKVVNSFTIKFPIKLKFNKMRNVINQLMREYVSHSTEFRGMDDLFTQHRIFLKRSKG